MGSKRNVKRFTSDDLRTFLADNYTTDRMVISIVGSADFKKVVHLCERYFGDYPLKASAAQRDGSPDYSQFDLTVNRHTHQMHVMMGCQAPSVFDERKVAFSLLNNIIGGPAMNSRLNVAIREKYGFCYAIESQYTPFSDAGLFYIYAGIDADARQQFDELVRRELRQLADNQLSTSRLHAAKQQYVGQMAINNELALNEMQAIGKSYLTFDHVDTLEEMQRDIESVTAAEITTLAGDLFSNSHISTLCYK